MNKHSGQSSDPKIVFNTRNTEYREKHLCDGIVFDLGVACPEEGHSPSSEDVLTRRKKALELLEGRLLKKDGTRRYPNDRDHRVAFCCSMAEVGADAERLIDTAEACNLILRHTGWHIRLLSRSHLLHQLVSEKMIPTRYHERLIFGFSLGTLDDVVGACIEPGTSLISERLESLRWLQGHKLRTFGMIAPGLPEGDQEDHDYSSQQICSAIRVEKCEQVWAEIINVRGDSLLRIEVALNKVHRDDLAKRIKTISGPGLWGEPQEDCAMPTFYAHSANIPEGKLRFLHKIEEFPPDWWWTEQHGLNNGAVLVGKTARKLNLTTNAPLLSKDEREYLREREEIVTAGVSATIAASKAIFEIHDYKGGLLWNREFSSFKDYCLARWGFEKSHSNRLRRCGSFIAALEKEPEAFESPIGDWLPKNEAQFRPITVAGIPEDQWVDFWRKVHTEKGSSKLTGTIVSRIAKSHGPNSANSGASEVQCLPSPKSVERNKASQLLKKLRIATSRHGKGREISMILDQIETLVL